MSDLREKLFYEQKNGYDLIGKFAFVPIVVFECRPNYFRDT